jgi:putative ATP-dependent endonuclease of OLD family
MAKATKVEALPLIPLSHAKVKRLIIKNFRCIGKQPVSIDLDDIVVLVGPNNAGKSTILRAYEVVMLHGSTEGRLKLEDFPGEIVDPANIPEIELQTYIFDKFPGEEWLHTETETGLRFVRERWRWEDANKEPIRQGHRETASDWDERVPWGAPGIANARRPYPHRVDAFASPETQGDKIVEILRDILMERAKQAADGKASIIEELTGQIRDLQKKIVDESKGDIEGIETSLSNYIGEIFVGFKVSLDTRTEQVSEKALNFFSTKPILRMGPSGGHMSPLEKQGSGARRTLLWSALKIASDRQPITSKKTAKAKEGDDEEVQMSRPHVLLLDEPEICLHPNAIRDACRVLYDLAAQGSGWQVMVTTHSPAFIDISRDNTTIVRVERTPDGSINGTTVFRPKEVKLDDDDKKLLKLLNLWDPYVAEFFFGGRTIIVEGDTEYSAFREVIEGDRPAYRDVLIVRARGKFIIPALMKIMNHFGSRYAVLHDSDVPKLANGNANGAWAANLKILDAVKAAPKPGDIRLAAFVPNFEAAVFGEEATGDKPYNAAMKLRQNSTHMLAAKRILDYLLFQTDQQPEFLTPWDDENYLNEALKKFAAKNAASS